MQLQEIKYIFHSELDEIYKKEEVNSFFYLVIEHYLKLERFVLALEPNLVIAKKEEQSLFEALTKLKLQEPIQYILGTTHFMDLEFVVNQNVLIPRPETEELVRWILEECSVERSRDLKILDIGTGSGCIAIALAKNIPNATVFALDISKKAIEIAKENAVLNKVGITFLKEDILEIEAINIAFDLIVSNPPYVRDLEKKKMSINVLEHEPHQALFVSDDNPLKFYKAIIDFGKSHLKEKGKLFFEINQYLAKETMALLNAQNFSEIELRKDIFGNDRMISAKRL